MAAPSTIASPPGLTSVSGTIARVRFHNPESGYCIMLVAAQGYRRQITVVGVCPAPSVGDFIEANGRWETHDSHGEQFRAAELRVLPPRTTAGIVRFLGSGDIKGLGKEKAKRLGEYFGERLADVLSNRPRLLEEVDGIGPVLRAKIEAQWRSHTKQRLEQDLFLYSYGITGRRAARIQRIYGEKAGELIRANPYRLCTDIDGIGFKTADAIAARMGVDADSPLRAQAAVLHVVGDLARLGDCYAEESALLERAQKLLGGVDAAVVRAGLARCVESGALVAEDIAGARSYLLPRLRKAEIAVAAEVVRLRAGRPPWPPIDAPRALSWAAAKAGIVFDPSQKDALAMMLRSKLGIITGGPGTGKSTIVRSLLGILQAKGMRIQLCAPTGKAARRLAESTGMPATTIHRLLGYDGRTHRYRHDADNPLAVDLVVADEFSMAGVTLARALLQAVPTRAAVLLLGDADQLPSIEPGAVLNDLIVSGAVPVAQLRHTHRQSSGSEIVLAAQMVNSGIIPDIGHLDCRVLAAADAGASAQAAALGPILATGPDFLFVPISDPEQARAFLLRLVTTDLPAALGVDPRRDVQVLTPMHKGILGTHALNAALQQMLDCSAGVEVTRGKRVFRLFDKVIQTSNDHEREVYNGDIGIIRSIDHTRKAVRIDFDGRTLDYDFGDLEDIALAYCSSVHKAQGSEWPVVVMPLTTEHSVLLDRRLLYTAVTRARRKVVLVGQRQALALAVKNARAVVRKTTLAWRLRRQDADLPTAPETDPEVLLS